MLLFRGVQNSFTDCLDSLIFSPAGSSTRSARVSIFDSSVASTVKRLQSMAKLGENLFDVKMQIHELQIQQEKYEKDASLRMQSSCSDADLAPYFQRCNELKIQQVALQKSERTIMATLSSIESQANIQQIKKILSYTVSTHQMSQDLGVEDSTTEQLLEDFNNVSTSIEQEKSILNGLDAHISELREDPVLLDNDIRSNPAFLTWKKELEMTQSAAQLNSQITDSKNSTAASGALARVGNSLMSAA